MARRRAAAVPRGMQGDPPPPQLVVVHVSSGRVRAEGGGGLSMVLQPSTTGEPPAKGQAASAGWGCRQPPPLRSPAAFPLFFLPFPLFPPAQAAAPPALRAGTGSGWGSGFLHRPAAPALPLAPRSSPRDGRGAGRAACSCLMLSPRTGPGQVPFRRGRDASVRPPRAAGGCRRPCHPQGSRLGWGNRGDLCDRRGIVPPLRKGAGAGLGAGVPRAAPCCQAGPGWGGELELINGGSAREGHKSAC